MGHRDRRQPAEPRAGLHRLAAQRQAAVGEHRSEHGSASADQPPADRPGAGRHRDSAVQGWRPDRVPEGLARQAEHEAVQLQHRALPQRHRPHRHVAADHRRWDKAVNVHVEAHTDIAREVLTEVWNGLGQIPEFAAVIANQHSASKIREYTYLARRVCCTRWPTPCISSSARTTWSSVMP